MLTPPALSIRFEYLVALACLVGLGMFGWHGFLGGRSVDYKHVLSERAAVLDQQLAALVKQSADIESRVKLMRPESVDSDMVEELIRQNLGLAKSTDLIIKIAQ